MATDSWRAVSVERTHHQEWTARIGVDVTGVVDESVGDEC